MSGWNVKIPLENHFLSLRPVNIIVFSPERHTCACGPVQAEDTKFKERYYEKNTKTCSFPGGVPVIARLYSLF
jgi:hypothetical protein